MFFKNRYDAAKALLPHLQNYRNKNAVILAVPRGGVPLGIYLAEELNLPFDIVLTKKIGHPSNKEYAIGAISLEGMTVEPRLDVPNEYIKEESARILKKLQERYALFMPNLKPVNLAGKTIIVVDDGIATGFTLMATISLLRKKKPAAMVVAVPVAPASTANKIKKLVDHFICLHTPVEFGGVGQFYEDFSEVTDQEVINLIRQK